MRKSITLLGIVLAWTPWSWSQAIDRQVLDRIQDATVFIKLKVPQVGEGSGSGFVIKATGDTVLVMTNRHVAVPEAGEVPEGAKFEISVVFRSGSPQQQELPATLLAHDDREVRDLAVLEVHGVKLPPQPIPANLTTAEADFYLTMPVYALGFPRGRQMQQVVGNTKDNPAITVNPMSISSLPRTNRTVWPACSSTARPSREIVADRSSMPRVGWSGSSSRAFGVKPWASRYLPV